MRQWSIPVAVSLLSVVAGIFLYRYTLHQPQFRSAPAPDVAELPVESNLSFEQISLPDLDGNPQPLSQWQEPVLIVNFWAPWCAPCRREIPALIDAQQAYPDQVKIVGLSFDSADNVREFANLHSINYPLLITGLQSTQLNRYFGNSSGGLPFTVFLNARREIVYQHTGEIHADQIASQIATLLKS